MPTSAPTSHFFVVNTADGLSTKLKIDHAVINITNDIAVSAPFNVRGTVARIWSSVNAVLDAGGSSHIFTVESGGVLQLEFVTLKNGRSDLSGGTISVDSSSLIMSTCTISNSRSEVSGGGVYLKSSVGLFVSTTFEESNAVR